MAALSTRLQLSDSEVCLSCSCDSRRSADSKFQWLRHELLIMSAVPPPPPPAVPSVAGRYVGVGRTRRDETSMWSINYTQAASPPPLPCRYIFLNDGNEFIGRQLTAACCHIPVAVQTLFRWPVAYRGGKPKFRRPSKIVPNSTRLWKLLKIAEFRTPTPQDIRKKCSKILKLPPVRNCFTLAMTNKLVVIINNLKVPKIEKILLYEMKFLVPNYSCLQNPWLGGLPPADPLSPSPQLNLLNPPPPNKIPGYATAADSS